MALSLTPLTTTAVTTGTFADQLKSIILISGGTKHAFSIAFQFVKLPEISSDKSKLLYTYNMINFSHSQCVVCICELNYVA